MILSAAAIIVIQDRESLTREGLPYWILWFFLSVAVLLLFFLFLRNKDLRQRINFFFLGAKQKSILIRLRMTLKKEKQKLELLRKDLGLKAWELDLAFPQAESVRNNLKPLEKKRRELQMEWDKIFKEIERLDLPAASAEDSGSARKIASPPHSSPSAATKTAASLDSDGRLRELEKRRSEIQEKIKRIEKIRNQHLLSLGKLADSLRPETPELADIARRIDETNQRISHIEKRMENLSI